VTMRLYPGMGHTVNQDEIDFVRGMMATLVVWVSILLAIVVEATARDAPLLLQCSPLSLLWPFNEYDAGGRVVTVVTKQREYLVCLPCATPEVVSMQGQASKSEET